MTDLENFPSSTNIVEIDFDTNSGAAVAMGIRQNTTIALYNPDGSSAGQKYNPKVAWIKEHFAKYPLN